MTAYPRAHLVLSGGRIHTLAPGGGPEPEALAVRDGRIVAAGSAGEIEPLIGPATRVVDLDGLTAVPGFNESHSHVVSLGKMVTGVNLFEARSMEDIKAKVREAVKGTRPGEWIEGMGWFEGRLEEDRFPNRWDLDEVAPENPVVLGRIYTMDVVNTRALELVGIDADTPDPPGGVIDRDPATGEPTGLLRENAKNLVRDVMPADVSGDTESLIRAAVKEYHSLGVTSVVDPGVTPGVMAVYHRLRRGGELNLRVSIMPDFRDRYLPLREERLEHMGFASGFGDDFLSLGAAKLSLDGGLYSKTAYLNEPYVDETDVRTLLRIPTDELDDIIYDLHRRGWCVGVHACGDAAQDLVVNAFARAYEQDPRDDVRHHLIHGYFPTLKTLRLMAEHDIIANVQPAFIYVEGDLCEKYVGTQRSEYFTPLKTYSEAGVSVAINSDVPTSPTADPMLGISCAVTRRTIGGITLGAAERISPRQALEMYTVGGARVTMEEDSKGRLMPGMLADIAVLNRDPLSVEPGELNGIRCVMTVLNGEIVYEG